MTLSKLTPLVSTIWLKEQILASLQNTAKLNNSLRVLDTSWLPDPEVDGYKQFYAQAHIPTALYFDLKKLSSPNETSAAKFPIPDSNVFKEYVENLGISNNTHVVAYDRLNTRSSFRTWFLFRLFGHDKISVLNGGLRQWLTDGFHVTTEEPTVEKAVFNVNFRKHLLRDFAAVMKNVTSQTEQLMDARPPEMFCVPDKDQPGGHIPGAKNIPFGSLFNEDGTVKSKEDLKKLFTEAGIDLQKPLVSSCQIGMTACGLIAAAYILGREDVPLYNGSFTEWSKLADPSMIVKEKQN
ncbi:unnamed protein product [Candidula unifasciata]|uniref:Rhodanese domain-containing protein n=1 Tax=Candidula unifasciata TaxID=100452 RepID=A0A8S4A2K0_9EUPU|nr:unnamed protein product [Candidula unifasciata]